MPRIDLTPTAPHLFPEARAALAEAPFSHRGARFGERMSAARRRLAAMCANRYHPVIAAGTGTWANELMVWNMLPAARRAAVAVNGEFGSRLLAQCRRCRPDTLSLDFGWGNPYERAMAEGFLEAHPEVDLLLAVALETSHGTENDLALLDGLAEARGMRLALDGISAVGGCPDLFAWPRVAAVTGSSGKALAALPGLALLFVDEAHPFQCDPRAPESLSLADIRLAEQSPGGVRHTVGSSILSCFLASLEALERRGGYPARLAGWKARIAAAARKAGLAAWPGGGSSLVTCFRRPPERRWRALLGELDARGIGVYTAPGYLEERGLFEIATMGDVPPEALDNLCAALAALEGMRP